MSEKSTNDAIVADIGGTFARLARVNLANLCMDKIEILSCSAYQSLELLLLDYRERQQLEEIDQISLAIASPVLGDEVRMTNTDWCFSIQRLKEKLALTDFQVLNDLNAIAMSLPVLTEQQLLQLGGGEPAKDKTKVVLGAGTGLGVAYLAFNQGRYVAHAGEGGHMSWGATTEDEWFIFSYLKKKYAHLSYERLLSGLGLENLYQALAALHHQEQRALPASEIISLALSGQCDLALTTVAQFFAILGSYAGDLALVFSAFGGVYLAGGVATRLISLLKNSEFRAHFEEKGRFSAFNRQIPTFVISAEQPGLLGAAVYLKQIKRSVDDFSQLAIES